MKSRESHNVPHVANGENVQLSQFINTHMEEIISEWENFAKSLIPTASDMTPRALRNHIKQLLTFIVKDMRAPQTVLEQIKKSQGKGQLPASSADITASPAETHAALRLAGGFNQDQMVSEYRALRASVINLWIKAHPEIKSQAVRDLTRFNEAIDQELTESIRLYSKKLNYSKNMFLAVLSHDLRNPVGAIMMSAELQLRLGTLDKKQADLTAQIIESAENVNEIVSHLLDLTKARFGAGLPVIKNPMDFGFVSKKMVDEMRAAYPERKITLEIAGDMEGEWDKARIGQVFSNLIGNAIQYSFQQTPIDVTVKGGPEDVTLSVHNQGIPIPPDKIGKIFDALIRDTSKDGEETARLGNLGLGLFITKEIVTAHGGTISVSSSEKHGTTFTAKFPRH